VKDKILVTGGLGYVGGRVCEYLSQNTDLFVSIGTRRHDAVRPDWLQNGEIVQMDMMSKETLKHACSGANYVVHLAAMNEIDCARYPEGALAVNGQGTLRLLAAAKDAGMERFIYFSTAHVYGKPLEGHITEQTVPRPVHPYAITHRVAEDFVLAAHDSGDVVGVVLRLSNSFGAPNTSYSNRWTLLVNDLCKQAVTEKKLILRSSGRDFRDFITLDDVSKAVTHLLRLKRVDCADGLFNLGGENAMRVLDMASLIAERSFEVLGVECEIVTGSSEGQEVPDGLLYDIDKVKATGLKLDNRAVEEIDRTLRFCQRMIEGGLAA